MGAVIRFPGERRATHDGEVADDLIGSAAIIILPVVRIERASGESSDGYAPDSGDTPGGKRRRRGSRT